MIEPPVSGTTLAAGSFSSIKNRRSGGWVGVFDNPECTLFSGAAQTSPQPPTDSLETAVRDRPMKMNRLIPMLPVKHIAASIEFYRRLGFSVEQRNDDWGWAMLRFDECRLMIDQSINQHSQAPRQSVLYLYPENIVEYHQQVRDNGLTIPDLQVTFYGLTEFRLDDPDGNHLWIGQDTATKEIP